MKILSKLLLLIGFLVPLSAVSADYPSKPINIVVPFAPGGPTDIIARLVAKHMSGELNSPVPVLNKPGAGGIIGTAEVSRARADGYTLLLVANNHAILPSTKKNLPFHPINDFEPIGTVGSSSYVLVVRPELKVSSVAELGQRAQKAGAPMLYGTPGFATVNHLAAQMLAAHWNVSLQQIDYPGAAPATTALLSGDVDFVINNLTSSIPFITAGQLRPLGLTGTHGSKQLPNTPLISETIPNFAAEAWYGLLAPKGVPEAERATLENALARITKNEEFRKSMEQIGVNPTSLRGQEFGAFIKNEITKWASLTAKAGIKPD